METQDAGFPLKKLLVYSMVVIAGVFFLAAFSITSLCPPRSLGNEASAISSLRTLTIIISQYRTRFSAFPASLEDLFAEVYIDSVLASGTKAGFRFDYQTALNLYDLETWSCSASPTQFGTTGNRYFFVDTSGVVRVNETAPATVRDPGIPE